MAYLNIPGVKADFLDGNLSIPETVRQPRLLILGSASNGLSLQPWLVSNVRRTETEFGAASEMLRGVHEAIGAGLTNIAVMRVGGRTGSVVITDDAAQTLTIEPESRDAEALERYALVIDGASGINRILVWDLQDEQWVYDSTEEFVIDEGVVRVVDTGLAPVTLGTIGDPLTYISLDVLDDTDFTSVGSVDVATVVASEGSDDAVMSLPERYAAYNSAYHLLDYRDADAVIPMSAPMDAPNYFEATASGGFFKGVPVPGAANDGLGYVWQYIYRGKLYTYMTDSATFFTELPDEDTADITVNTDLVITALKPGVGGNSISIQINAAGAAGPTVVISEPTATSLKIMVTDDGSATTTATVTAINTALDNYTLSNGVVASELVEASGGGVTTLITVANTALTGGDGAHYLSHNELTGDFVPTAVHNRFLAGTDAELRRVNFGHQLATFLWRASTTWKTMIGAVSTLGPSGLSYQDVADWVGSAPVYTLGPDGKQLIIDAVGDNGTGLLGMELVAGKAASGGGYRNAQIKEAASSTDGYAFGGLILTKGESLPNFDDFPDHAYGIDDTDERTDANRKPVDIGKHLVITYDYPVHRNGFNGGSSYRGPVNTLYMAKLMTMPENEEPIGENGAIGKISSIPRIHATQLDQLARQRMVGLRREEGVGFIFTSGKTAAHPTSDWVRISTIRSVNRIVQGLRRGARKYIGKSFSPANILALQNELERYLQSERDNFGIHNGARIALSYTREQKILGNLTLTLQIVPPFSIQQITIVTSLAADESEL